MTDGTPTVLLTRPRAASEAFAATLPPAMPVLIAPLVEIVPIGDPADPADHDAVIFTSSNAVGRVRPVPGLRAFCVGDATARAAADRGFDASSASGDVVALVDSLGTTPPGGRMLYPHGAETRGNLAGRLRARGLTVDEVTVYRQADIAPSAELTTLVGGAGPVIAPVFSPLAAARLLRVAPYRAGLSAVAISRAAADPLLAAGWAVQIASEPDAPAMRIALEHAFSAA